MDIPDLPCLLDCADSALQQMELAELDLSAQCMKRAEHELKMAIAHREKAGVFRFLIDNRDTVINLSKKIADGKQGVLTFPAEIVPLRRRA